MRIIEIETLKPTHRVRDAAAMMLRGIRNVYITEGERLIGVVGERDLLTLIEQGAIDHEAALADVMRSVEHVRREQLPEHAYVLMKKYHTTGCPVTDEEGNLLGIVTFHDTCEAIARR